MKGTIYSLLFVILLITTNCTSKKSTVAEVDHRPRKPVAVSLSGKEFFEPERSEKSQAKLDNLK